jgi:hypothetical protein
MAVRVQVPPSAPSKKRNDNAELSFLFFNALGVLLLLAKPSRRKGR